MLNSFMWPSSTGVVQYTQLWYWQFDSSEVESNIAQLGQAGWVQNIDDSMQICLPLCWFHMPEVHLLPSYAEWVKNVVDSCAFISIRLKRFVSLNVSSTCPKSICTRFNKYSGTGLWRMGSKCCQFDAIWLNWCH